MAIELDRQYLKRYRHLADNPIYYNNAIQYMGGELYRAIVGYELLWSKLVEDKLMLALDYFLSQNSESYFLTEMEVVEPMRIYGTYWFRGIKPDPLHFQVQTPFSLAKNEKLIARINLLDKPMNVDIETEAGLVFSIPYMRYKYWLDSKRIRVPKEVSVKNEKQSAKREKNSYRLDGKVKELFASQKVYAKLLHLPKGNRRATPL